MKKRIFFMAMLIAVLSFNTLGQNARKYYKAGTEFVDNLKYEDAIVQFSNAIELDPSDPEFYNARGQTYEKLLKYPEAKSDYEKALVFSPKNLDILVSLGAIANKTGNYKEALKILNQVSGIDKRNPDVYPEKIITLIGLEMYDQALKVSDTAVLLKDTPKEYYYRGVIYRKLNNDILAKKELEKSISKDKKYPAPRLELADLLIPTDTEEAMKQCNAVIEYDSRNTDAYMMRSKVYKSILDYPAAIDDISKNILIDPLNPSFYLVRGLYYQEFNQHTNAINDFSKYISMRENDPDAYFARAKSYEEIMNFEKAMADFTKITVLSEFDVKARKMQKDAETRLYELNREKIAPEISIANPVPMGEALEIRGDKSVLLISGKVKDKSKIKSFLINDRNVILAEKGGEYEFLSNVDVTGLDKITFIARDEYNNEKVKNYTIKRTEINPPVITLISPYTSEDGRVFLDSPTPNVAIQGKITDESQIRSITIGDVTASYRRDEMNPRFTAILEISNLNKFLVVAEDIYGNLKETEFVINREGANIVASNPMGRTWVVFVENSSYETFASLDGPIKDVSIIRRALANYQIHNIIHKKDMTKTEMERFFNIELRDLVKKNQVKSLMVWYAGHGKFINDVGYWIPVDAKRDDEFTYYNINGLRAGLQGYGDVVVHTLVISDACESGPGFYTSMRSLIGDPKCDNTFMASSKSAQVLTSAGYEIAVDNSKFTSTFANSLINNKNACIPIETIVRSVSAVVSSENGQKPKFGKIQGLEDMGGTFFFISK